MSRTPAATPVADPYRNPELARWLDSAEGVPLWVDPAETAEERAGRSGWRLRGNAWFGMAGALVPGLALAAALAWIGALGAEWLGRTFAGPGPSPVSPILVAIVLGLAIRNSVGLPGVYEAGLQLALKRVLRLGVALLGIRLSLAAAGAIGLVAVPVVLVCIASALLLVTWVGRAVGLPARLGTLIAVGTAICGNTAVVATGPVIGAREDEVSYAVGCITIFGLIALLAYPALAHGLFDGDARLAGLFLGTAIHDTAQVAGAGLAYHQQYGTPLALDTATVTKLVRNLFMLAVIPLMAVVHHRRVSGAGAVARPPLRDVVPLFVFGFVAMTALRTLGDLGERPFGVLPAGAWTAFTGAVSDAAQVCLGVAMASVGLGTSFARLRRLGLRPLLVGLVAAALVGGVSFVLVRSLGPWLGALHAG